MKKIMFNDRYGLTEAVLEGRKTMTRRILKAPRTMEGKDVYGFSVLTYRTGEVVEVMAIDEDGAMIGNILPKYNVGEVVAVAQSYKLCEYDPMLLQQVWVKKPTLFPDIDPYSTLMGWVDLPMKYHNGWDNKMFVLADLMPHQIRITNVRVERLQDISDDDCFREGIYKKTLCPPGDIDYYYHSEPRSKWEVYPSARAAFAALIDKISGKGTWESNPWVFVYEFAMARAEEKAKEYENSLDYYHYTSDPPPPVAYKAGYEEAEKDVITLIESRIGEILGDAQPAPVLRTELRELINKIKEK